MDKQDRVTSRDLKELLRKSRSPLIGERAEAVHSLRELGPAGIEGLIALVAVKNRNWRARRRAYLWLVMLFVLIALPGVLYCVLNAIEAARHGNQEAIGRYLGLGLGGILGGFGGGLLGGFAWLLAPPSEIFQAANLLAQVDDMRGIGAMARVLDMRLADAELRHSAGKALARLLPLVDESNVSVIQSEERAILARYLGRSRPDKELELVLGILNALSWAGDANTLKTVRAFGQRMNQNPPNAALLDGLANCCQRIEARIEIAALGSNLLRPSLGGETSNLLRPAAGVGTDDQTVLLRAGADDMGSSA